MPIVLHPFRRKNPPAHIPETIFPDPYFFTDTEHKIIDESSLLNTNGLISHQSSNLLEQLGGIMERRLAKGMIY